MDVEKIIKMTEDNVDFIKNVYDIQKGLNKIASELSIELPLKNDIIIVRINYIISMSIIELNILQENLKNTNDNYSTNLYIKQTYLYIYETVKLYEKKLASDLIQLSTEERDRSILKSVSQLIKTFKKNYSYSEEIKTVRNIAIAHFDYEILDFLEILEGFDKNKCINMISEFIQILYILFLLLSNIYIKISKVENIDLKFIEENINKLYQFYNIQKTTANTRLGRVQ